MSISIWQTHPSAFKLHEMFNMMLTPMSDQLASVLVTSACICECFRGCKGRLASAGPMKINSRNYIPPRFLFLSNSEGKRGQE